MRPLTKRRAVAWVSGLLFAYLFASLLAGIFLAEMSIHLPKRPLRHRVEAVQIVLSDFHTDIQDVSVVADDKVQLRAWYIRPTDFGGDTVILLHGVTDNREGVAGFARMFLKHGYAVLLPDARAHGESGGGIATYGVLERNDVKNWAEWIRGASPGCVYLFGESMGAAIALQATAVTPEVCAVVVESPYSTFREIAYDRIAQHAHVPTWFVRIAGRPMLEMSLAYAWWKYNVDLTKASPEDALEASRVPSLLIHGTKDRNIPIRHSYELIRTCGSHAQLWVVEGADHGGAVSIAPQEFEVRVVGWFREHHR